MKIGIAGAGAVGCHYGSKLIQAGFDVLLLARGQHLTALQHTGLRHESEGECKLIPVNATADIRLLDHCHVVILSCKMTGLREMLESLQDGKHHDTLLVTLQNGVEAPDMVSAVFPEHAISAATAFIGARLEQPGHVIHSAAGGLRTGLWRHGCGEQHLQTLVEALQVSHVPIRLDNDPAAMLWRKMLWNCGFNAITAITRRYARDMATDNETLKIVRQTMQETVTLANTLSIGIDESDMLKHIEITLAMGPVKTSMWQDIEVGRHTEVDYINGYITKKSETLQIPAPANRMLTSLIHAIEKNYRLSCSV